MGGSAAFCFSDHVTQKTLMDVERGGRGREQRLLKRGIRYRATSKVCGCFNLSLRVSPLAGEDGGLGKPSRGMEVGVRVWGSAGHRLVRLVSSFPLHTTSTLTIISLMQQPPPPSISIEELCLSCEASQECQGESARGLQRG